jgi:putative transposase
MEKAFTSVFVHIIISVKSRKSVIPKENLEEVFENISGIIRKKRQNPVIVGGVSGHIHLFVSIKPGANITTLVKDIKNNSANFINLQDWMKEKFAWQNGFGVFSYGNSQVEQVTNYIRKQDEIHKTRTFREEYIAILQKFGVDYDEKGLPPDYE